MKAQRCTAIAYALRRCTRRGGCVGDAASIDGWLRRVWRDILRPGEHSWLGRPSPSGAAARVRRAEPPSSKHCAETSSGVTVCAKGSFGSGVFPVGRWWGTLHSRGTLEYSLRTLRLMTHTAQKLWLWLHPTSWNDELTDRSHTLFQLTSTRSWHFTGSQSHTCTPSALAATAGRSRSPAGACCAVLRCMAYAALHGVRCAAWCTLRCMVYAARPRQRRSLHVLARKHPKSAALYQTGPALLNRCERV
jgi:hypothetical protein